MKEEISQLVDSRGRRPASNSDAIKLYSYSASLPMYRRKYDWKIPTWCAESIKCLHSSVRKELTEDLGTGPEGLDERLNSQEMSEAVKLLRSISARSFYAAYVTYGTSLMRNAIVSLVQSEEFATHLEKISSNPDEFSDVIAATIQKLEEEHLTSSPDVPLSTRDDYDLGALWSRVADDVNAESKAIKNKLATECCAVFLNSTPQGKMIDSIKPEEVRKLDDYFSGAESDDYLKRGAEVAEKLGLTLYQLLKAKSAPAIVPNQRWEEEDDERLLQCVQRQVNVHSTGHKRNAALCWKTVARQMGNKSNEQCRLRWRAIGQSTRDYPFDDSQLYMLQILYAAYGENWQKIAKLIPGKLAHQCRTKFFSALSQPDRDGYLKYYMDLRNAILNHSASINVRKWWNRVDWLGAKLIRIASITKNRTIMEALHEFYATDDIPKRINLLYNTERIERVETLHGSDVLTMAEYLMKYSSRMVRKMVNAAVTALLKKAKNVSAHDFQRIFEVDTVNDAQFHQSLVRLLRSAWP